MTRRPSRKVQRGERHVTDRSRRAALAVVVAVAVAIGAVAVVVAARDSASRDERVTVTVDTRPPGRTMPRSFLGLSVEFDSVGPYMGTPQRPNTAWRRLI